MCLCSLIYGQNIDPCDLDRYPARFNGKMISVRATTWHGTHNAGIKNNICKVPLDWRTPESAGVSVRFKLKRDDSWKTFAHYDAMSSELHTIPTVGPQYQVTATIHGLFIIMSRRSPRLLLVIESVSDVKIERDGSQVEGVIPAASTLRDFDHKFAPLQPTGGPALVDFSEL